MHDFLGSNLRCCDVHNFAFDSILTFGCMPTISTHFMLSQSWSIGYFRHHLTLLHFRGHRSRARRRRVTAHVLFKCWISEVLGLQQLRAAGDRRYVELLQSNSSFWPGVRCVEVDWPSLCVRRCLVNSFLYVHIRQIGQGLSEGGNTRWTD